MARRLGLARAGDRAWLLLLSDAGAPLACAAEETLSSRRLSHSLATPSGVEGAGSPGAELALLGRLYGISQWNAGWGAWSSRRGCSQVSMRCNGCLACYSQKRCIATVADTSVLL